MKEGNNWAPSGPGAAHTNRMPLMAKMVAFLFWHRCLMIMMMVLIRMMKLIGFQIRRRDLMLTVTPPAQTTAHPKTHPTKSKIP